MKILLNPKVRHFIRILIAMLLSYIFYNYIYHKALGLMLFSTFVVMLTSTGSALFQGLLRFFLLIMVIITAYILFPDFAHFYNNMDVIFWGSCIGVLVNTLIFPDKVDLDFKRTVVPLLKTSRDYFSAIIFYLIDHNQDRMHQLNQNKLRLESALLLLPIWIYQPGFDFALQKGYRYYFMQLNHLVEILFAMHYLARFSYDRNWIATIESSLLQCEQGVNEFVAAIMILMDLEKLKEGVVDFEDHISHIECIFNKIMSVPLELLETHSNVRYLAEFAHNLRELRVVLIQLAKALR